MRAKNRPSREVVSRSLQHSPASLIFLLLLQLGVARTWKELFIAKGTLASKASNSECHHTYNSVIFLVFKNNSGASFSRMFLRKSR